MNGPVTENLRETVILWQDHTHPHGYWPTLKMLTLADGSQCLELSVHGTVTRLPYHKAECDACESAWERREYYDDEY